MVTTPPGDVTWLNKQDLAAMNTTMLPSFESTYTPGSELVPGSAVHAAQPAPADQPVHANTAPEHDQAYTDGRNDRVAFEQWIDKLQGRYSDGARWWAANRSHPRVFCQQAPGVADPDFNNGCQKATRRLAPSDRRRLAEPTYRVGWNSL